MKLEHAWTGSRMIHVLNPDPQDIILSEVATGLSREGRYGGAATLIPWSVGQHCLFCDDAAFEDGVTSPLIRATILLHDGPEYMLRDMISPVKRHLPDYKNLEKWWWLAFAERFGLPLEIPGIVKHYDGIAAVSEKESLISPDAGEWPGMPDVQARPIPAYLLSMTPCQVEREFMSRTESFLAKAAI